MNVFLEQYVKKLFYKKYNLDMDEFKSKIYIENGILWEKNDNKKKKEKHYCATSLMDIGMVESKNENNVYKTVNIGLETINK